MKTTTAEPRDELVILAGSSCAGDSSHSRRRWWMTSDRRLSWETPSATPPVTTTLEGLPGVAAAIAVDAFRGLVLLETGEVFSAARFNGAPWVPHVGIRKEIEVLKRDGGAGIVAAGSTCGGCWLATHRREIMVWDFEREKPVTLFGPPVPGTARIVTVDVRRGLVVTADGGEYMSLGETWLEISNLLSGRVGRVRARVTRGYSLGGGVDVSAGEVLELTEAEFRSAYAIGRVEPLPVGADPA